ncbi:MAG TPA: ATP-binding protein, partial [Pyrinomonadaceae bacterium]|nr:ATP-binding protein [Pyrinomonadaceae bacterium]
RIWVGLSPTVGEIGLTLLVTEPREGANIVQKIYTTGDGLPAGWVTDLYADENEFWIGTTRGLCLWQGEGASVCKTYNAKNDLCDYDIWAVTKDKDGNLWTGSKCGAKEWKRFGFTSYTEADGTGNPLVNSIFENRDGELFATFNDGAGRLISRFDGEKFQLVKPNFPDTVTYFGWGWQQTVLQDHLGEWWIPTGSGLYRFGNTKRFEDLARGTPLRVETGAKAPQVFRVFEDSRGDIWISTTGTPSELLRWDRRQNKWHDLTAELNLSPTQLISMFVETNAGDLWIGSGNDEQPDATALIRYRADQFRVFTEKDGVPAGWIRDLFIDHAGRLWIANAAVGLLRADQLDGDTLDFVSYTTKQGLSSAYVACITEDEFGRIYAGTGRGVDRLTPESGQIETFTTADGLPASHSEIAYRDKNNGLWFGTANGLARFTPGPVRPRVPPNALITGVRVAGVSQPISVLGEDHPQRLELAADKNQVSVDFLGLGASLGEKLSYEYRLSGADWTPTIERTVNFSNLRSGDYTFEFRAITGDRIYSEPAVISFYIATPIWKRWWVITSAFALAILAVYLFYKNRFSHLIEMERMRTRIATDLHDDIGANLTRISLLSEVAKQSTTNGNDHLLGSIAGIARESVASMNDIVWAISPEHDSLLDLTRRMRQHADEIFTLRDIELDLNAPADDAGMKLSVGVRRDVLLIFKEAVNNAARHSGCSRVHIDFGCEHYVLTLTVVDNGGGFDPAITDGDGHGLRSMMRRARSLGGELTIDSRPANGTSIRLILPLAKDGRDRLRE